jgi:hypothetical protein
VNHHTTPHELGRVNRDPHLFRFQQIPHRLLRIRGREPSDDELAPAKGRADFGNLNLGAGRRFARRNHAPLQQRIEAEPYCQVECENNRCARDHVLPAEHASKQFAGDLTKRGDGLRSIHPPSPH